MTKRLYYTDALLTRFSAVVTACEPEGDVCRVRLDRTAFYPTSGGQPHDTGRLGERTVRDVVDRDDGEVEHVIDGPLTSGETVSGEIDWARRFDHMQQHTGQHVLSAAFDRLLGAVTVSFHLGAESATIDLDREVTDREVDRVVHEADYVIWDDRPVVVRFVEGDEVAALPWRKPPARTGRLRVIEVPDFDISACGGTHVPRTGRIGMIAVTGRERFRGGSRITFVCGRRALASHDRFRDAAAAATRRLSVGLDELGAAIERLQSDLRVQTRTARGLREELAAWRGAGWRDSAEAIGPHRGVIRIERDEDAAGLKALALAFVAEPGLVCVLIGGGEPAPVVVARSADVEVDAGALVRSLTTELGGRGGGRPDLAQGGVTAAPDVIAAAAARMVSGTPGTATAS